MLRLERFKPRLGDGGGPEIDLSIDGPSLISVTGPNGCGKTSTLLALAGLLPYEGSAELMGRELKEYEPAELRRLVRYVPDDPYSAMVRDRVLDEVYFSAECMGLGFGEAVSEVERVLRHVGLIERADDRIFTLSGGQIQRLALASALVAKPKLLLLDNSFTHIDEALRAELAQLLLRIVREGTLVLAAVSDPADLPLEPNMEVTLNCHQEALSVSFSRAALNGSAANELVVEEVWFGYVRGVEFIKALSMEAKSGQVVALVGPNGSGKSTVLKLLTGALRPRRGKIALNGTAPAPPRAAYCPQNPSSYLTERVASEELIMARGSRAGPIVEIRPESLLNVPIHRLSTGVKRVLAVLSSALRGPALLALDEPVAGLDARNKEIMREVIRAVAELGSIIVIASHDRSFVRSVSDDVYLIQRGSVRRVDP
ncbi:MAG: ATP-binding cassette domain-containing protein [Thaumarchaeota archaeon]|nr:ATP-binding cassette domain-containing protein [Candidatus Calditenuaceae archaeon]MDW8042077.1 ATP-binding cassette domain-containing protein [Nitrososphaerota archaeon]